LRMQFHKTRVPVNNGDAHGNMRLRAGSVFRPAKPQLFGDNLCFKWHWPAQGERQRARAAKFTAPSSAAAYTNRSSGNSDTPARTPAGSKRSRPMHPAHTTA
jgi:hypothetical protein